MTAASLLQTLRARGFVLALTAKGVTVSPASALSADELAELRTRKAELTQLLQGEAEGLAITAELTPAAQFMADLQAEGALPDCSEKLSPRPRARASQNLTSTAQLPDGGGRLSRLSPIELQHLPHPDLVERIRLGAGRLGELIQAGQGDSDEARGLTAERTWIERHRADAWRSAYRPRARARLEGLPFATPIGDLTPAEHIKAVRAQLHDHDPRAELFLATIAYRAARDGPGSVADLEYRATWQRWTQ